MKDVLPCGTLVCLSDVNALTSKATHTVTPRQLAVHRSLSHRGKLEGEEALEPFPKKSANDPRFGLIGISQCIIEAVDFKPHEVPI